MARKGGGLGHFPAGKRERELRDARREQIRQARQSAQTIERDGRQWKLVRLPDGAAGDWPEEVEDE